MTAKKKRTRKPRTPEQQARKDFRKASDTHVTEFELDVTHQQIRELLTIAKSVAYIKRRLQAYYRKVLEQYHRTRKYRETVKAYHSTTSKQRKKELGKILNELQESHGITPEAGRELAAWYAGKCGVNSVFALTAFEDVWKGVEKVLYKGAKKLGKKHAAGDTYTLRAKQSNRAIIINSDGDSLSFSIDGMIMKPKIPKDDLFLQDEQAHVLAFMNDDSVEKNCIDHFMKTGEITPTYRPKYATIKVEKIRSKWRVYAQVTIEGEALPKKKKDGSPRFERAADGEIGLDLGVSSYAAVGANIFEMKTLAERNGATLCDDKKLARLQRHADRCLREANPGNYNEDGTVRKGRKSWVKSKEYLRTLGKISSLHRKAALNRKYAIREDVNRLREYGSVIVAEKQSVRGWQDGLFGKSIGYRCPGAFREELKRKFVDYIEVDIMYRASQYDHESGEYHKKKLSERRHVHSGGRSSPRDGYSGFLLWCHDGEYLSPDQGLCVTRFEDYLRRCGEFVEECKCRGVSVANGGF